jgi:hypothetical protein
MVELNFTYFITGIVLLIIVYHILLYLILVSIIRNGVITAFEKLRITKIIREYEKIREKDL